MALVLSRKPGEKITIGGNIVVEVVSFKGGKVRLGISAPDDVEIIRNELIGRQVFDKGGRKDDPTGPGQPLMSNGDL